MFAGRPPRQFCFLIQTERRSAANDMSASESIYNLIPQPVPPVPPVIRYVSKHGGDKPPTFSTFGLTATSKPGYQNVAGAEGAAPQGKHVYKKPAATMGTVGNAKAPSQILKKGTGGGGGAYDANGATSTGNYYRLTFWPESRVARTACLARLLAVYSLPALYSRRRLFFSACRSAPSRFALAAQRAFGWLLLLLLHAVLLLLSALRSLFSRSLLLSSFFQGPSSTPTRCAPRCPARTS